MQDVTLLCPVLGPNDPEGHGRHEDCPCEEMLYVPAGHGVHEELPALL